MKFILKFVKGADRMKSLKSRVTAVAAVFLFVFVLSCSAAFIIKHTSHKCSGSECLICTELARCRSNLRTLDTAVAAIIFAAAVALTVYIAVPAVRKAYTVNTLINMKVELLN